MRPLEAAWDIFLKKANFSYFYRPTKFGLYAHDAYIPAFAVFPEHTKNNFYLIDIQSYWPLKKDYCERIRLLCQSMSTPLFVIIGWPGEHKIVQYMSSLSKKPDWNVYEDEGFHWDWHTKNRCAILLPEQFLMMDFEKGFSCSSALIGQCPRCNSLDFISTFLPCRYCKDDLPSLPSNIRLPLPPDYQLPFDTKKFPWLNPQSPYLQQIYTTIKNSSFKDYFSGTFDSPIEQLLWEQWLELPQNIGQDYIHLSPQFSIDKFRVDFAHEFTKIIIELDGHATHSSPDAIAYDRRRQRYLESENWQVIRFGGKEVFSNARACAEEAWNIIHKKILTQEAISLPRCQNPTCGKPILQVGGRGHRKREYCNDRCRQTGHRIKQSQTLQAMKQDIEIIKKALNGGSEA